MQSLRIIALATLLAVAATAWPALAQSPTAPEGAQSVRAAAKGKRVRVIARLKAADAASPQSQTTARAATASMARKLAAAGVTDIKQLGRFPMVVLEVDERQLEALLATGEVESVQEDAPEWANLAQSVPLIGGAAARAAGADGSGQLIAILDTGIDGTHPMLAGKVVEEACFSTTDAVSSSKSVCPNGAETQTGKGAGVPCKIGADACDHGTHVAGIAVGSGKLTGVAPAAKLVSIQVFSRISGGSGCSLPPCAGAYPSDQLLALEHVLKLVEGGSKIAAVNMSLGGGQYFSACDNDVRKDAIDALRARGVATVIASGNNGYAASIATPACISTAVAVGATTDYGTEAVAAFSNSATMIDVLAPGDAITSSVPGGGYEELRGTSMAAPHVAGAFAALRDGAPGKSVDQIEAALESTGRQVTEPKGKLARPRTDVAKALKALGGRSGGPAWQDWADLGGSGQGAPSCLVTGGLELACWVRTSGNALAWNRLKDGAWSGWTNLGGSLASDPACVQRGSRIDCFAVGLSASLQQITYDGTAWGAWGDLGQKLARRPACLATPSGTGITCLALGQDKAVWQRTLEGSAWTAWASLGGSMKDQPECGLRSSGIDCWALGGKGTLQYRRFSGGAWTKSWQTIKGTVASSPSCVGSACFARNGSGKLVTTSLSGGKWSAWKGLDGSAAAAPACIAPVSGQLDCFTRTGKSTLAHRRRQGSAWGPWEDLGGSVAARPTCVAASSTRIDCLAVASDKRLKHLAWN